jgi:hypothetical protein
MNAQEAFIRAETLWPGEQAMVEPLSDGWMVVTPNGLHLTHILDHDGNPVCHDHCKNIARDFEMKASYRTEIYDVQAALEYYHDNLDVILALRKCIHEDAARLGRNYRVPGVRIVEQPAEAAQ